jgi:hypothetical protein
MPLTLPIRRKVVPPGMLDLERTTGGRAAIVTVKSVDADLGERHIVLGAMNFGTAVDEATSMNLLDQFVDQGGRWIDTANCYAFWAERGNDRRHSRPHSRPAPPPRRSRLARAAQRSNAA